MAQTFSAASAPTSGRLSLSLALAPIAPARGAAALSLDVDGAFESRGPGRVASWSATLRPRVGSRSFTLGLVRTGSAAYVEVSGGAYRLPAAAFATLAQSFDELAGGGRGATGASRGVLAGLGLSPLRWIVRPRLERAAGAAGAGRILEVRAGVRGDALLDSLEALLARASAAGAAPRGAAAAIAAARAQRIPATGSGAARFALWTTASGHTLRRLLVTLTLPVGGQLSALLGGARAARATFSLAYTDLDRPQRISAPGHLRPFGELAARLVPLLAILPGAAGR